MSGTSTLKVYLTSKSPIKVAAVKKHMDSIGMPYKLVCHKIESSDIPEQPVFENFTLECAKLRINDLKKAVEIGPREMIISIESGIKIGNACVHDFPVIVIEYDGKTLKPASWYSMIGNRTEAKYFDISWFKWHPSGLGITETYGQFLHERDPEMYPNPKDWSNREMAILSILQKYKILNHLNLKHSVGLYPDFKAEGVMFNDMSHIFACPDLLEKLQIKTGKVARRFMGRTGFTHIVAIESRGYPLGMMVLNELKDQDDYDDYDDGMCCDSGIVFAKKKGKVPGDNVVSVEYKTEYSTDCLEMMGGLIGEGDRVLIVDDLVATGGSLVAAKQLVEKCGATVVGALCFLKVDNLYDDACEKFGHPIDIIIQ